MPFLWFGSDFSFYTEVKILMMCSTDRTYKHRSVSKHKQLLQLLFTLLELPVSKQELGHM